MNLEINEKIDTKMKVLPFLLLKRFLNSLWSLGNNKFHIYIYILNHHPGVARVFIYPAINYCRRYIRGYGTVA
jgi:hypothetical protein